MNKAKFIGIACSPGICSLLPTAFDNSAFCSCKKQIEVLMWVCPLIDHRYEGHNIVKVVDNSIKN